MKKSIIAIALSVAMLGSMTCYAKTEKTVFTVNDEEVGEGLFNTHLRISQASTYNSYKDMYAMYGMEMPDEFWDTPIDNTAYTETESVSENVEETESLSENTEETESVSENTEEVQIETEGAKTTGESFRNDSLNGLAEMILLRQKADEYNVELSDEDKQVIDEEAKNFIDSNEIKILEENSISEEDINEYYTLNVLAYYVEQAIEDSADIEVTDEEAACSTVTVASFSAYDFEDLDNENVIVTSSETEEEAVEEETEGDIHVKTPDENAEDAANAALKELLAMDDTSDADMNTIARQYDQYAYAYDDTFGEVNDGYLSEEIIEAAKTLEEGEIYDKVINANGNYCIVRLNAKFDQEATDNKRAELLNKRKTEYFQTELNKMKEDADIVIDNKVLSGIKVTDKDSYITVYQEDADDALEVETEQDYEALYDEAIAADETEADIVVD